MKIYLQGLLILIALLSCEFPTLQNETKNELSSAVKWVDVHPEAKIELKAANGQAKNKILSKYPVDKKNGPSKDVLELINSELKVEYTKNEKAIIAKYGPDWNRSNKIELGSKSAIGGVNYGTVQNSVWTRTVNLTSYWGNTRLYDIFAFEVRGIEEAHNFLRVYTFFGDDFFFNGTFENPNGSGPLKDWYPYDCDLIELILADDTNTSINFGEESVRPVSAVKSQNYISELEIVTNLIKNQTIDGITYNGAVFEMSWRISDSYHPFNRTEPIITADYPKQTTIPILYVSSNDPLGGMTQKTQLDTVLYQIEAYPNSNYLFDGWTKTNGTAKIANTSSISTTVELVSNSSQIVGNFIHYDTLNLTVSPNGSGTTNATTIKVPTGRKVDIIANAATGYTFDKWVVINGSGVVIDNILSPNTKIQLTNGPATIQAQFKIQFLKSSNYSNSSASMGGEYWKWVPFDYNGDNKDDVLAYYIGGGSGIRLQVFRDTGDSSNYLPLPYTNLGLTGSYSTPWKITVGDFNGDNKKDVLAFFIGSTNEIGIRIQVFFSNGDGTFTNGPYLTPASSGYDEAWKITVIDTNGDNKDDVICYTIGANTGIRVRSILSNGDGTFNYGLVQNLKTSGYGTDWRMGSGNFNLDNNKDLVALYIGASGVRIQSILSIGDGTFVLGDYLNPNISADTDWSISSSDISGDGLTDFVLYDIGNGRGFKFRTLICSNSNSFITKGQVSSSNFSTSASSISVTDVNGDGINDIIAKKIGDNTGLAIQSFISMGDGTFIARSLYQPFTNGYGTGYSLKIADFDGDGKNDIIAGSNGIFNGINLLKIQSQ